jgi:hypothetical protein
MNEIVLTDKVKVDKVKTAKVKTETVEASKVKADIEAVLGLDKPKSRLRRARPVLALAAFAALAVLLYGLIGPSSSNNGVRYLTEPVTIAAVIGVVFAVMIGTGSFLIWKSQEIRREQAKPATSVSASVSASASASASNAVAANRDIAFTISPPEAKISIDGTELDATIRAVPRPPAGTTVPVVVHAPGYEDQTSLIDYFTA